jgi:hypothetical protein
MANPPPTTQMVPKMNPMSITMPNADEAPDERLPVVCASMGVNPASLVCNIIFIRSFLPFFALAGCYEIITTFFWRSGRVEAWKTQ